MFDRIRLLHPKEFDLVLLQLLLCLTANLIQLALQ